MDGTRTGLVDDTNNAGVLLAGCRMRFTSLALASFCGLAALLFHANFAAEDRVGLASPQNTTPSIRFSS